MPWCDNWYDLLKDDLKIKYQDSLQLEDTQNEAAPNHEKKKATTATMTQGEYLSHNRFQ